MQGRPGKEGQRAQEKKIRMLGHTGSKGGVGYADIGNAFNYDQRKMEETLPREEFWSPKSEYLNDSCDGTIWLTINSRFRLPSILQSSENELVCCRLLPHGHGAEAAWQQREEVPGQGAIFPGHMAHSVRRESSHLGGERRAVMRSLSVFLPGR